VTHVSETGSEISGNLYYIERDRTHRRHCTQKSFCNRFKPTAVWGEGHKSRCAVAAATVAYRCGKKYGRTYVYV